MMFEMGITYLKYSLDKQMKETYGIERKAKSRVYQKSYPISFNYAVVPRDWKFPNFLKFSGDDDITT